MIKKLLELGFGPSVEDKFFDKYHTEQKLKALRSVYTASTRPVKPGVNQS
jgi:hypothetical protein